MKGSRKKRERRPVDGDLVHAGIGSLSIRKGDIVEPQAAGQKTAGGRDFDRLIGRRYER
ncbi:hypothetical protein D3C80_647460 [compost metagenome]